MDELRVELPQAWFKALALVRQVAPEAVIAGGCLRDLLLGGAVKDVDIFVAEPPSDFTLSTIWANPHNRIGNHLAARGWQLKQTIGLGYCGGSDPDCGAALEYDAPGLDVPVQIISMHLAGGWSLQRLLARMDFNACQIASDGSKAFYTPAALWDLTHRKITLSPHISGDRLARSLRRALRFREKYAGTDIAVDTGEHQCLAQP